MTPSHASGAERVETARADEYVDYQRETGLADILATPGNVGALLLRREEGDATHFATISLWESESAIAAFSGSADRTARLEPRDEEFLVSSAPEAEHHELAFFRDRGDAGRPGR